MEKEGAFAKEKTLSKPAFIIFHSFFALLMLAMMFAIQYVLKIVCYIVGGGIILLAILFLFGGTRIVSGVLEDIGVEYVATNLGSNLITAFVVVLIGGAIVSIPTAMDLTGIKSLGALLIFGVGILIGYKMMKENRRFDELSDLTVLWGKLAPIAYVNGAVLYIFLSVFNVQPLYSAVLIVAGAAFHVMRMVGVCREYDF